MKIAENIIYVFQVGKVMYGVAKIQENFYGSGFKLVKDKEKDARLNAPVKIKSRAIRNVITEVGNVLNVIKMYGNKILDRNGDIKWDKVKKYDQEEARKSIEKEFNLKEEMENIGSFTDKLIEHEKNFNIGESFKVEFITSKEAKENNLI